MTMVMSELAAIAVEQKGGSSEDDDIHAPLNATCCKGNS